MEESTESDTKEAYKESIYKEIVALESAAYDKGYTNGFIAAAIGMAVMNIVVAFLWEYLKGFIL